MNSNVIGTMRYELDIPLSCMALNIDSTQIVVAGRNHIELFTVDTKLKAIYKMKSSNGNRTGKTGVQMNNNISDVAWSKSNQSLLASASTNGSITIWQLGRQLTEQITLVAHSRSVNKVLFCDHDPNLVLSASQDNTVKFFDIRGYGSSSNPTIAMQLLPKGRSSPVRDVQVCPYLCYNLAVANENGDLQIWDVRNNKKYVTSITSHYCSIMSIDWYPTMSPESHGWLATAGCRDHLIKIWEVSSNTQLELICSIRTSNVNRIAWRKEEYQIASSSNLNIDLNVHVWDIKRPYIPFASFEGHQDLITGIRWSNDRNIFFSVAKDGAIIRHSFADADHLINSINPIATDINPCGRWATAVRSSNLYGCNSNQNKRILTMQPPISFNKVPSAITRQKFNLNKSHLFQFARINQKDEIDELFNMNSFIHLAKQYKLFGDSISKLCFHNSEVALSDGNLFITNLWLLLNNMYARDVNDCYASEINSPISCLTKDISGHATNLRQDVDKGMASDGATVRPGLVESDNNKEKSKPDISTGNSEENSDSQFEDTISGIENFLTSLEGPMSFLFDNNQECLAAVDMLYNDVNIPETETTMFIFESDIENLQRNPDLESSFSTNIINDSIHTRSDSLHFDSISRNHSFSHIYPNDQDLSTTLQNKHFYSPMQEFPIIDSNSISLKHQYKPLESSVSSSRKNSGPLKENNYDSPLKIDVCMNNFTKYSAPGFLNYPGKVGSLFEFFQDLVDQNYVQTVCTAIIVLASKLNFNELTVKENSFVETWFHAYISLLVRFKLWTIATKIIKLCPLPSINSLNLQSTLITTKCGRCDKILDKYGSMCNRHSSDKQTINCSICHLTVHGEFVWCHGCGHGGHSHHIAEWYKIRQVCPTGCGHRCQFS